jgi:hypothetical protein
MATKDKPPTMTRDAVAEAVANGEQVGTPAGETIKHKREIDVAFASTVTADGKVVEKKEIEAVIIRDANGRLTRAGMERAIALGGSVMWAGEVYTDLDQLPDEVELARDNERANAALASQLDRQMADLATQRARLDAPANAPAAPHAGHATHAHAGHAKPDKK